METVKRRAEENGGHMLWYLPKPIFGVSTKSGVQNTQPNSKEIYMSRQYQLRMLQTLPHSHLQRLYNGRFGRCGRGQDYWRK